jgi:hypothetical protein
MDDTMSKDPRRVQEAKQVADAEAKKQELQAALPKLPYDPKALAREEFERSVDVKIFTEGFDKVWESLGKFGAAAAENEVLGGLTEVEFRDQCSAYYSTLNALHYRKAAEKQDERALTFSKASLLRITDRIPNQELLFDLANGMIRKGPTPTARCLAHPNGCPTEDGVIGLGSGASDSPLEFVKALLTRLKRS